MIPHASGYWQENIENGMWATFSAQQIQFQTASGIKIRKQKESGRATNSTRSIKEYQTCFSSEPWAINGATTYRDHSAKKNVQFWHTDADSAHIVLSWHWLVSKVFLFISARWKRQCQFQAMGHWLCHTATIKRKKEKTTKQIRSPSPNGPIQKSTDG